MRGSAAARLLRSWVRIPPGAWMFVCCECCVLSGRGPCDELITRPEESYRLWCVVVCDLETSRMRRPWLALGHSATPPSKSSLFLPKFARNLWPSLPSRCSRPWKWALQTVGSLSEWAHRVTVSCYGRPVADVQPNDLQCRGCRNVTCNMTFLP